MNTLETKNNQGFTLIELLAIIAIIALLASAALYALNLARIKSRNARRVADISQIVKGLELFYNYCGAYPALPPATFGIRLDRTKSLYSGTISNCNSSDAIYGSNGVLPNGGIGNTHAAGAGETLFINPLPTAPTPIDNGTLAVNNRCTDFNSQTGYRWGEYSYYSEAPGNSNKFWVYFCIGSATGSLQAGRHILTEKGVIQYTGDLFP